MLLLDVLSRSPADEKKRERKSVLLLSKKTNLRYEHTYRERKLFQRNRFHVIFEMRADTRKIKFGPCKQTKCNKCWQNFLYKGRLGVRSFAQGVCVYMRSIRGA